MYIQPQVLVTREFRTVPATITGPLRAFLVGPQAKLHLYSDSDEKPNISLGSYDYGVDTSYDWPNRTTGARIDESYTKLFIDNALLTYFSDLIGEGGTVAPVSGHPNRVRSTTTSFKDNGDYARSTELLRDVKLGDTVYIRGSDGSDSYEKWSYVRGFKGDVVASTIGAASIATGNHANQGLQTSINWVSGNKNNITLTHANGSAYNGLATGDIDETYYIEVLSGSIAGDLTTARVRITTASGRDNISSFAPSAEGAWTNIGTRGLKVQFEINPQSSGSSLAEEEEVSPNDLVPGQKWSVRVKQAYTRPTVTSSGTYVGDYDTTYIAEVLTGGGYSANPTIRVTTTTGVDVSGPTEVSVSGTPVALGTQGALITFTGGTGLCKGDKWEVVVTAEAEGAIKTLILGHDIPDEILTATDLDLKLFIKKNIQVEKNRLGYAPVTNWSTSQTEFTVTSNIIAFDSSWVDDLGDEVELPVEGGTMYVEYREWLADYVGVVDSLDDASAVDTILGTVHPDNPLAYGVYKALTNSGGTLVRFTAVENPDDTDSWNDTLHLAGARDDIYNLVPLTRTRAVLDLFAAHCADYSTAKKGLWRGAMFNIEVDPVKTLVSAATSDDEEVVLAKLSDDPDTSGTQYTYLRVTSGNAELATLGVEPLDVVRFLFTTDGFGNEEYTEFVVEDVINETTLRLATGHSVAITTAQRVEIVRNLSKAEIAAEAAVVAGTFSNELICCVWPDTIGVAGEQVPGYYLCAALAGLRSGVVPHQGLTNVEILGFDSVDRTTQFFSNSHLDTMAEGGVWIVTQAHDGTIYSRHAITTDVSSVDHREEMVRVNVHSMMYVFLGNLRPFIGKANVTDSAVTQIRVQLDATIEYLKAYGFTELLGAQLIDGVVKDIRRSPLFKDRLLVVIELTIPYPLNNLEVNLVI